MFVGILPIRELGLDIEQAQFAYGTEHTREESRDYLPHANQTGEPSCQVGVQVGEWRMLACTGLSEFDCRLCRAYKKKHKTATPATPKKKDYVQLLPTKHVQKLGPALHGLEALAHYELWLLRP